jgi:2-phospho-L-lactate/phosphoenolpyruvate guanylyltransferase
VRGVQGTVSSFNEADHDGSLLLDDGTPMEFPATAFAASGLRLLRVGQRVRVELDDAGTVRLLTLPTLR